MCIWTVCYLCHLFKDSAANMFLMAPYYVDFDLTAWTTWFSCHAHLRSTYTQIQVINIFPFKPGNSCHSQGTQNCFNVKWRQNRLKTCLIWLVSYVRLLVTDNKKPSFPAARCNCPYYKEKTPVRAIKILQLTKVTVSFEVFQTTESSAPQELLASFLGRSYFNSFHFAIYVYFPRSHGQFF